MHGPQNFCEARNGRGGDDFSRWVFFNQSFLNELVDQEGRCRLGAVMKQGLNLGERRKASLVFVEVFQNRQGLVEIDTRRHPRSILERLF